MSLQLWSPDTNDILLAGISPERKDHHSRIGLYVRWLNDAGKLWLQPSLPEYAAYLQSERRTVGRKGGAVVEAPPLSPATVNAHLSTIRRQLKRILEHPTARDFVMYLAEGAVTQQGHEPTPANIRAYADELERRLLNEIKPGAVEVREVVKQDRADSEHLRLTRSQAASLQNKPGTDTLRGLRDSAMIALMLCTGLREAELCALEVDDLRQYLQGELSCLVKRGKGSKQRLVPYGELQWCLIIVDCWLAAAGITEGPVFRGIRKGGKSVRPDAMTTRAVQLMLARYPIVVDGKLRDVKPHDCRRTYARRLFEANVPVEAIRQNLGHRSIETTLGYIGELGADLRRPPSDVYEQFDFAALQQWQQAA